MENPKGIGRGGINLVGQVFTRLTVLSKSTPSKHGENRWLCLCLCGKQVIVLGSSLRKQRTRSCGCLMRESSAAARYRHGGHGTPTYRIWAGMIQRCVNDNLPVFPDYGGRGIKVDPRWRLFAEFKSDMGDRPSPSHTIERIDVNGDYTKTNCRWAVGGEQQHNKRTTRWLTWNGKTMSASRWARVVGLTTGAIFNRLNRDWPVEKILTTPLRTTKRRVPGV